MSRWRNDTRWRARHVRVLGSFLGTLLRTAQPILGAEAAAAAAMPNVLPPHPGGIFAALQAAPGSELAAFMHTGHDQLLNAASIWRALPLPHRLLDRRASSR